MIFASRVGYAGLALSLVFVAVFVAASALSASSGSPATTAQAPSSTAYVIDAAPNDRASDGAAVNVPTADGPTGATSLLIGSDPDAVLSPDGTRLFGVGWVWTSEFTTESVVSIYDTRSGELEGSIPLPHRMGTTGFHFSPQIAVAPDAGTLYVLVTAPSAGPNGTGIASVDVRSETRRPDIAPLPDCGGSPILLPTSTDELAVVCRRGDIRIITISSQGDIAGESQVHLPLSGATVTDEGGNVFDVGYVADAVLWSGQVGPQVVAVTRDGMVFVVDVANNSIMNEQQLDLGDDEYVVPGHVKLAVPGSDGTIVVGTDTNFSSDDRSLVADDLRLVSMESWSTSSSISVEVSGISMSPGASGLYVIRAGTSTLAEVTLGSGDVHDLDVSLGRPVAVVAP